MSLDPTNCSLVGVSSGSSSYTIAKSNLWCSSDSVYISNNHNTLGALSPGEFMIGDQTIEEKVQCEVKKALDDAKYNIDNINNIVDEKSIFE